MATSQEQVQFENTQPRIGSARSAEQARKCIGNDASTATIAQPTPVWHTLHDWSLN
jgi:hypothetical protein